MKCLSLVSFSYNCFFHISGRLKRKEAERKRLYRQMRSAEATLINREKSRLRYSKETANKQMLKIGTFSICFAAMSIICNHTAKCRYNLLFEL